MYNVHMAGTFTVSFEFKCLFAPVKVKLTFFLRVLQYYFITFGMPIIKLVSSSFALENNKSQ